MAKLSAYQEYRFAAGSISVTKNNFGSFDFYIKTPRHSVFINPISKDRVKESLLFYGFSDENVKEVKKEI